MSKATDSAKRAGLRAVRWLGAYGRVSFESIGFERNPGRPVSAEAFLGKPNLRRPVGLLVDIEQTDLLAGFAHDAWTPRGGSAYQMRKSGKRTPQRPTRVGRWDLVVELAATTPQYVEVVIQRPRYVAVVFDRRDDRARGFAKIWGAELGLPIRGI